MAERLPEDHVTMLGNAFLKLLLEVTAAVLVLAQRRDLALKILEAHACEPVDYKDSVR